MALFLELEKQGIKLFKYRGTLPIFILVFALALFSLKCYNLDFNRLNVLFLTTPFKLICLLISLLGLFIRIHTLGYVHKNTSGRNTTKQIAEVINTTGMYSLLRHPLYLGNFLMWLGIGILTGSFWFNVVFILGFWIYYERIMYAEETFLINKFKEQYTQWSANVPAFIPKLKGYIKPNSEFSTKKVLRQEKSGVAALFTVFMIFHQIEYFFRNESIDISFSLWNVLFLIFGVYLVVIKLIQKTTDWLYIGNTG